MFAACGIAKPIIVAIKATYIGNTAQVVTEDGTTDSS